MNEFEPSGVRMRAARRVGGSKVRADLTRQFGRFDAQFRRDGLGLAGNSAVFAGASPSVTPR
jgi:hypothetical protein